MNYELFKSINQFAGSHPFWDALMVFVSERALIIYAVVLLLMWLFGKEEHKHTVLVAAVTGIVALAFNFIIAHIYFEPRPFVSHTVNLLVQHKADASFPSDHTTGAFALSIAVLLCHRKIGFWMILFAIMTGISRIYVGNHYPFDVLGSIIISIIVSLLVYKIRPLLKPVSSFFITKLSFKFR
ncbi:undecaprenyl-diphosphatase [Bacillus mexicanus]|uniref:undecaprenyl-diphosphatase n=1 Tax=Bacillus mexicanus TaxID=2834415 RepID=UPI003D2503CD